jgi:hypothetical protein
MIWMRDRLNSRGLEGSDLECVLDTFLKISAQDFADVKPDEAGFNEVVSKYGHDTSRLVFALGAIGRGTR